MCDGGAAVGACRTTSSELLTPLNRGHRKIKSFLRFPAREWRHISRSTDSGCRLTHRVLVLKTSYTTEIPGWDVVNFPFHRFCPCSFILRFLSRTFIYFRVTVMIVLWSYALFSFNAALVNGIFICLWLKTFTIRKPSLFYLTLMEFNVTVITHTLENVKAFVRDVLKEQATV